MIGRLVKLAIVGSVARRVARNPAVSATSRTLFSRFARRREAGRWHHVDPPGE